jgi:hypothetical protein
MLMAAGKQLPVMPAKERVKESLFSLESGHRAAMDE